jgi:hypothetical protein
VFTVFPLLFRVSKIPWVFLYCKATFAFVLLPKRRPLRSPVLN